MKNILRGVTALIWPVLISVFLAACGGGGGDSGGGSDGGGGISYSGSASKAAIDGSNAGEISISSYQNGGTGGALGGLGGIQTEGRQIGRSRSLKLTQALKKALLQADMNSSSGGGLSGAMAADFGTISGDCPSNPGSASFTITYDDVSGNFTGGMTFNNYCSEGVTISDSASFSGRVRVSSGDFLELSISFDALSVTSGSDSFATDGDIAFNFSASPATVTMTMLLRDNSTSEVFKIEDLSMTLSAGINYVDVNIVSGRSYHPDYGYTDLSTSDPLRISLGDEWPFQGVLDCTGNTGIGGGSTKSRLIALSSTQYHVEADTDGDGAYDYDSGPLTGLIFNRFGPDSPQLAQEWLLTRNNKPG